MVGWRGSGARLLHRRRYPRRAPLGVPRARAAAPVVPPWSVRLTVEVPYAELHCLTNFTFLRGASHPHELVGQAVELGYEALAVTDECSVAGVVRAHVAAKGRQLKLIIGSELRLTCGLKLVALATNRRGYGRLCRLITRGRRAGCRSISPGNRGPPSSCFATGRIASICRRCS